MCVCRRSDDALDDAASSGPSSEHSPATDRSPAEVKHTILHRTAQHSRLVFLNFGFETIWLAVQLLTPDMLKS